MRIHKAEIFFLVLMTLVGLGGASSWAAWSSSSGHGLIIGGLDAAGRFSFMGMVLAALACTCGMLLIYPAMSRDLREHGRLREMTETLSTRSQSLEYAAVTDGLTGMHNRRYFDDALAEYLAAFKRIDKPIGMAIFDLDHFKKINDTHGHDVGDEVLRQVALCLQEYTRFHDVVARLGGEEFAILSPAITEDQLYKLADRIREAVSRLNIRAGNVSLRLTLSAGVAVWNRKESGEDLYRRADKHLYVAKHNGRNRVCAA